MQDTKDHQGSRQLLGLAAVTAASIIWGCGFVFQRASMDYIGPYTFSAIRNIIAWMAVELWIWVRKIPNNIPKKGRLESGLICGFLAFTGTSFQQVGLVYTTAGKAGFIGVLFIVIVPLASALILRRPVAKKTWLGVLLACVGFYLLSMSGATSLSKGDLYEFIAAFLWAAQILAVEHFAQDQDPFHLSVAQFRTIAIFSALIALGTESLSGPALIQAMPGLLYAGLLSSALGFPLQILGEKILDPTIAALLMSIEGVVSAIVGSIILHESLTGREILGCGIILLSVALSQLPWSSKSTS